MIAFSAEETRMIRRLIERGGPQSFVSELINTMRDIADCEENSDTCVNELCHVASALENGMETLDVGLQLAWHEGKAGQTNA